MSRRYIQHLRSKEVETIQQYGLDKDIPKLPESDNLKDGEIAINYAEDNEVISIKNDKNDIVKFLNEKVIYEDEEITAAAISQLKNETNQQINDIHNIIDNIDPSATVVQSDWDETDESSMAFIQNKPTALSDFTNDSHFITGTEVPRNQAQSDWDEDDQRSPEFIQNKPTALSEFTNDSGFITLNDVPELVQTQSDWNETDDSSAAFIQNKPTALSEFTNDSGFITLNDADDVIMGKIDGNSFYKVESWGNPPRIEITYSSTAETGDKNKLYVDIPNERVYRFSGVISMQVQGGSPYELLSEELSTITTSEINAALQGTTKKAVSAKVLRDNFYTETEVDNALALKQNIDDVYVDQTYVDTNTTNSFTSNNKRYNIAENITLTTDATYTFGSGCILHFYNAGKLNGAANLALNNTQIEAPMKQCFDLNINFTGLMRNSECYPEWWGARGDGVSYDDHDDADAINRCIYNAGHTTVVLTAENYLVKSTIGFEESFKNPDVLAATQGSTDNTANHLIVKHNIIGDASLAGPVLIFATSFGTCRVEGAILVRNASDNSIGFSTFPSAPTNSFGGSSTDIFINSIVKGGTPDLYSGYPTGSSVITEYGIGHGIGALLNSTNSTINIRTIAGFEKGVWLCRAQNNIIEIGVNESVYCFYIAKATNFMPSSFNSTCTRNRITLGIQCRRNYGYIVEVNDSSIIREIGDTEIAMNHWTIGDSNNGANYRHPHKHSLYYTAGDNMGHTGNEYNFNITYGVETKRTIIKYEYPFVPSGTNKGIGNGDIINFGVSCYLQDIDIPYGWNVKLNNVLVSNTARSYGSFRWFGQSGVMLIDSVTISKASTPIWDSSSDTIRLLDINPQHNGNIISADTVPATCEDNKFYVVDGTGVITTNGTKKYPVYCKYFGTDATLIGYTLNPTFAPIFSPAFTGTPTTPTPNVLDNSTQIANTAYVRSYVGQRISNVADHMITATYDSQNDVYELDMTFADCSARVNDDLEGSNMFVQLWLNGNNLKFKFARLDVANQFVYFDCDADVDGVLTHYELMYCDDEFAVLTATPIQDKLVSGTNVSSQVTFSDDFINRCSYNYTDDTWITL